MSSIAEYDVPNNTQNINKNDSDSYSDQQLIQFQNYITQSEHILVNPHKQFCVVFEQRPFQLKLRFCNGFNLNLQSCEQLPLLTLTRPEYIWGWYSTVNHISIPIGSKLIAINGQFMLESVPMVEQLMDMMQNASLPAVFVFEMSVNAVRLPPSIHIEIDDTFDEQKSCEMEDDDSKLQFIEEEKEFIESDDEIIIENIENVKNEKLNVKKIYEKYKPLMFWWLDDGGHVLLVFLFFIFFVIDNQFNILLSSSHWPIIVSAVSTIAVLFISIPPRMFSFFSFFELCMILFFLFYDFIFLFFLCMTLFL